MNRPRRVRRGFPFRFVAAGLVALTAVALTVAVLMYTQLMGYERVAARHLPAGVEAAVRIDVEQRVLFDPVRRRLLPVLRRAIAPSLDSTDAERLFARLKGRTGLELGVDLREIVVASGPGTGEWGLVLGGLFPRHAVLEALHSLLQEAGVPGVHSVRDGQLRFANGRCIAASDTGLLVIASSCSWVSGGLRQRSATSWSRYLASAPIAAVSLAAPVHFPATAPEPERVNGGFGRGSEFRFSAELAPPSVPVTAEVFLDDEGHTGQPDDPGPSPLPGESTQRVRRGVPWPPSRVFERATVRARSEHRLVLESTLTGTDLEEWILAVAQWTSTMVLGPEGLVTRR